MRSATESPSPAPTQRRGHGQHFPHARTAFGAFVTNDQNIASFNGAMFYGGESGFLHVEYSCRAAEGLEVVARYLHYTTFRGEIAFEDHEAARRLEGRV